MATSHDVSFVLGAALAGGFGATFNKAANTMGQLQRKSEALKEAQAQLQKYQKLKINQSQAVKAFAEAKTKTENYRKALMAAETNAKNIQQAFNAAAKRSNALKHSLDAQQIAHTKAKREVQGLSTAIKGNSAPTQVMIQNFNKAKEQSQRLASRVKITQKAFQGAKTETDRLKTSLNQAQGVTKAIQGQFSGASKSSQKLDSSLRKQGKTLRDLGATLQKAGVDTVNLSSAQAKLEKQSGRIAKVQTRLVRSKAALAQAKQDLSLGNISGQLMAAAGIIRLVKTPLVAAANFEQAMAKVKAVSGASSEEIKTLTLQARQLGQETMFSASEAAAGQELLARAGFKTKEIMVSMPGLLNMAAAEGMGLAEASDIASNTLKGFNLPASETMRVVDVLAKASASSNVNIGTLGESMKMVAPIASGLGISIEQTTAMIGAMGNAGIKGSEAGTALRAALLRLSEEPKAVENALKKMGIASRDAQGKLRSLPSLMKSLSKKMKGMGEADQIKILSKIYGVRASSGMLSVMNSANNGVLAELEEKLRNAEGASAEMADTMNDTAQGAMRRLHSASESLQIALGNTLLPVFATGADMLAQFAGQVSAFAEQHPKMTGVVTKSIAAFGVFNVTTTATSIAIKIMKLPFQQLKVLFDSARVRLILLGESAVWLKTKSLIIAGATKAWAAAQWVLNAAMNASPLAIFALVAAGWALFRNWDKVSVGIVMAWDWIWSKIAAFGAWLESTFTCNSLVSGWEIVKKSLGSVGESLAGVGETLSWVWKKYLAFEEWLGSTFTWENLLLGWEMVKNAFTAIPGQIREALAGVGEAIKAPFREAFQWILGKLEDIKGVWNSVVNFLGLGGDDIEKGKTPAKGPGFSDPRAPVETNRFSMLNSSVGMRAAGGLITQPELSWIGEAGKEVIIPIEQQARGRSLWLLAGKMLGMLEGTQGPMGAPKDLPSFGPPLDTFFQEKSSVGNISNTTNQSRGGDFFNLNFTIHGDDSESLAQRVADQVKVTLEEIQERNQRLSFA